MGTLMRLTSMAAKEEWNENHRLVQVLFTQNDLPGSNFLGVEKSTYFPSGKSPVHAEAPSEEIIYFRRGRGKVLRGNAYEEVGPGSAVTIPSGIEHHVINTGEDLLDHILVSADIGGRKPQSDYIATADDCLSEDLVRQLSRLSCRRIVLPQNEQSAEITRNDRENLYTLSAGFAVAHVKLAGTAYEWQYSLDASSCLWIPAGVPHFFRNTGDCPLQIVNFQARTGT